MANPQRHLIVQLTDFHLGSEPDLVLRGVNTEKSLESVAAHLERHYSSPDLLILTGDLAEDPSPSTYSRIGDRFGGLNLPVYFLPGNHDDPALMTRTLTAKGLFGDKQISCGRWRILLLDSTQAGSPKGRIGQTECRWLSDTLDELKDYWVMIALHHHPIKSGSIWMDTMMTEDSDAFLTAISSHENVRAVIFGHVHQEMDQTIGNIRFMGTPSTCVQFTPNSETFSTDENSAGFRLLELDDSGQLSTQIVRIKP